MKFTTLCYLGFLFLLMISITYYSQYNFREGLTTIDPSIVDSNIPQGNGLSNQFILDGLNQLIRFTDNTKITKITIVGNDNNYRVPMETLNPGTLSLNGRPIGTIGAIIKELERAAGFLKLLTANAKSIDIQYTTQNNVSKYLN